MKARQVVGLFSIGLFTAILLYPTLHEAGHSLLALIVGAKVVDFNLFPIPNIMCDVFGVGNTGIVLIGLGGIIIPYVLSMSLRPKTFWLWYSNALVRGISLLAVGISFVSIVLWMNGIIVPNEDIIQVLKVFNGGSILFLTVFAMMLIFGIVRIVYDKPLKKIIEYFEIEK